MVFFVLLTYFMGTLLEKWAWDIRDTQFLDKNIINGSNELPIGHDGPQYQIRHKR